jgi:hypothetical protein
MRLDYAVRAANVPEALRGALEQFAEELIFRKTTYLCSSVRN